LLTCYSPVRRSSTPKGLSARLACVKHAASVRPEPGSNSPTKTMKSDPSRIKETAENKKTILGTGLIKHPVEFSRNKHPPRSRPHREAVVPGATPKRYPTGFALSIPDLRVDHRFARAPPDARGQTWSACSGGRTANPGRSSHFAVATRPARCRLDYISENSPRAQAHTA
jgi:hypothetical protein